ncbi:hypothetical protein HHI36_008811 [Cryptolaemus montrouzieri]|uniref:Endonuclease/exonuclease/phosphatase domain-containing protein n=1 Tax=Cryptolaemus montrouzieri TaxID=559131 RepID=A0ABD2MTL8_9CUCU
MDTLSIQILSLYRSPFLSSPDFVEDLKQFLHGCRDSYDISVLVGDININSLDSENHIVNEYLNALYEEGYISTINTYTRKQGDTVSCLDHISVNNHNPVILGITFPEGNRKSDVRGKVQYKSQIDYTQLAERLEGENWGHIYDVGSAKDCAQAFVDTLKHHIKSYTKTSKILRKHCKRKIWRTNGLLK